jgi:hypothetical protein
MMETTLAAGIAADQIPKSNNRPFLRRVPNSNASLVHYGDTACGRKQIEAFIADEYRRHFSARLTEFMPTLVGLHGHEGELEAAAGYRAAVDGPLFLEAYTDGPVEGLLKELRGIDVQRNEIVEVGSLACRSGRAAMEMVAALVPMLIHEGFSWVVFTGADTVRNVFRRMHLKPFALCIANKSVLGDRQHEWGSYYDHNPVVMAGPIAEGIRVLAPVGGVQ